MRLDYESNLKISLRRARNLWSNKRRIGTGQETALDLSRATGAFLLADSRAGRYPSERARYIRQRIHVLAYRSSRGRTAPAFRQFQEVLRRITFSAQKNAEAEILLCEARLLVFRRNFSLLHDAACNAKKNHRSRFRILLRDA